MYSRYFNYEDKDFENINIKGKIKKINWSLLELHDTMPNKAFIYEKLNYVVTKINKLFEAEDRLKINTNGKENNLKAYMKKEFKQELKTIEGNKQFWLSIGNSKIDEEYLNLENRENIIKGCLLNVNEDEQYCREELFLGLLEIIKANRDNYLKLLIKYEQSLQKEYDKLAKAFENTNQINQDIQNINYEILKFSKNNYRERLRKFLKDLDLGITEAQEKKLKKSYKYKNFPFY
ncbi:hypothetical protein N5T82_02700 [Aliarcobacter cryaerophilus]|uniref:hypothetical protein n=1 Tax=Aliarcobacter cryaerophilus TaxID=28198 RepID=UPI0021B5B6CB|nr:hypothetical protein [Aliarcobacter cryaerophilus]MCT7538754.1 hypothetical protein [Aliarcobacter cryaerophilus]